MGTLCTQFLLQFYADSFDTLLVHLTLSEDANVVFFLNNSQINFCDFLQDVNKDTFRQLMLSMSYQCLYIGSTL